MTRRSLLSLCAAAPLLLACGFLPPTDSPNRQPVARTVSIIFTAAPVYESLAALRGDERFPQGAQLMLLRGAGKPQPLVEGFAATADASLSFDGKSVLFAGRKSTGDRWQIWEMPLAGSEPRLALAAATDLIRPLWMPGERFVFARATPEGFVLETATMSSAAPTRLSYGPGSYLPDDVLRDGRLLFESGFPLGAGTTPEMYLMYADGSGVESVRCDHPTGHEPGPLLEPSHEQGREHGRQLTSGDVIFTHGPRLARFTSALASEEIVAAPSGDYAGDVAETSDGRWLLAVRRRGEKHYALAAWKPGSPTMSILAQDTARDLVEPLVVAPRDLPKRHPSALHGWTIGNLLALDARQSRDGALSGTPVMVRAETTDSAGRPVVLGTAPVERDGSFFVRVTGDTPLRFALLDAEGRTLREEQGWFWIRKGEQRICVGCHVGPERAPDNRVPEVLLRTTTPVDLTRAAGTLTAGGH